MKIQFSILILTFAFGKIHSTHYFAQDRIHQNPSCYKGDFCATAFCKIVSALAISCSFFCPLIGLALSSAKKRNFIRALTYHWCSNGLPQIALFLFKMNFQKTRLSKTLYSILCQNLDFQDLRMNRIFYNGRDRYFLDANEQTY